MAFCGKSKYLADVNVSGDGRASRVRVRVFCDGAAGQFVAADSSGSDPGAKVFEAAWRLSVENGVGSHRIVLHFQFTAAILWDQAIVMFLCTRNDSSFFRTRYVARKSVYRLLNFHLIQTFNQPPALNSVSLQATATAD